MPDDPDAVVSRVSPMPAGVGLLGCSRSERLFNSYVHGMELVVAGYLLDKDSPALIFEDEEVPQEVQETALVEDSAEHDLEFSQGLRGVFLTLDRPPGLEPLLACPDHPYPSLGAVGDHKEGVGGKERGNLKLVGLELMQSAPDGGVLSGGVLEFDDRQRQAVEEEHNIRPAIVLALDDRELVDREPVVLIPVLEVDDFGLGAGDAAVGASVLHVHAVGEHAMKSAVAGQERGGFGAGQLAVGVIEGFGGQAWVQALKGLAQAGFQDDVMEIGVGALREGLAVGEVR